MDLMRAGGADERLVVGDNATGSWHMLDHVVITVCGQG